MEEEQETKTSADGSADAVPTPEVKEEKDPLDLIDAANAAADRLEAGNKELAKLIAMQQKSIIEKTLSGKTEAGVPQISEEEKKINEAKKFLKGTGYEDELFKNNS